MNIVEQQDNHMKNTTSSEEVQEEQKEERSSSATRAMNEPLFLNPLRKTSNSSLEIGSTLKPEVKQATLRMLRAVQKVKDFSNPLHPHELFQSCQELFAYQAWLINYLVLAEHSYRAVVREFQEGGEMSAAAAEVRSKATMAYMDWRWLVMAYELVTEQVLLLKRFFSASNEEFKQT